MIRMLCVLTLVGEAGSMYDVLMALKSGADEDREGPATAGNIPISTNAESIAFRAPLRENSEKVAKFILVRRNKIIYDRYSRNFPSGGVGVVRSLALLIIYAPEGVLRCSTRRSPIHTESLRHHTG